MPNKDSNVTDDVIDNDVTDNDVTDTDDVTDDNADDQDVVDDDATDGKDAQDDGGKKPASKQPTQRPKSQTDTDDPAAGLKRALTAERQAHKKAAAELKELQKKHATAEERQLMEAREQAASETEARVKAPLIKALAVSELKAAGVQQGTSKLVGLLDLEKVELNEDGELVGLEEQIDDLKTEFPNLFAAATGSTPPRVPNVNGGAGNGRNKDKQDKSQPKGFAQILADQVMAAVPPGSGVSMR